MTCLKRRKMHKNQAVSIRNKTNNNVNIIQTAWQFLPFLLSSDCQWLTNTCHLALRNGPFQDAKRAVLGRETGRFRSPNGPYWNAVKIFPNDFVAKMVLVKQWGAERGAFWHCEWIILCHNETHVCRWVMPCCDVTIGGRMAIVAAWLRWIRAICNEKVRLQSLADGPSYDLFYWLLEFTLML